jgi:flagellar L-ring protein precursor FlgH
MKVMTIRVIIAWVCISFFAGCEPRHIKPYTPRHRQYDPGEYAKDQHESAAPGSFWNAATPSLFEDLRASRIGDILIVIIDEQSKGEGDATTSLSKKSGMDVGITSFLGLVAGIQRRYPDVDPSALIKLASSSDFSGEGATSRTGKLEGRLAVRVRQVLPNGDLFIEGHKVILLNEEELHFYVSGVVRQSDVSPDNSLLSSLIADAQVEFSGRGVVADQQKPGWLHRLLNKYSPI